MNSKILSTIALFGGLASLPLYAADFNNPILSSLISPITYIDPSIWFLLCFGMAGLIVMRKFVR